MTTIDALPRIPASTLSALLLEESRPDNPTIAIIDVRDDDHIGGHIRSSTHIPSHTLDHKIPELVQKLKDKDTVVFHCALSQQRGPNAASRYIRERERLLGAYPRPASTTVSVGEMMKKSAAENAGGREKGDKEVESGSGWEDEEGGNGESKKREEKKEQKVYILDRGFVGWQELYGEDERLTEGYVKDIWRDGYWM